MPDFQSLAGKRILLTGGTTGIGLATAVLLAAEGAKIFTFGRDKEALEEALQKVRTKGGQISGTTADVSKKEDVSRVFVEAMAYLGGLDILINNAGIAAQGLSDMEADEWRYVVETNLVGYMACAHEAMFHFKKAGTGQIVFIGSMSAELKNKDSSVYVATKSGIRGFVESFRKEVNKDNVRAGLIEPGLTEAELFPIPHPVQELSIKMDKMLKSEDIAEAVKYMLIQPERCDVAFMQIKPIKQEG